MVNLWRESNCLALPSGTKQKRKNFFAQALGSLPKWSRENRMVVRLTFGALQFVFSNYGLGRSRTDSHEWIACSERWLAGARAKGIVFVNSRYIEILQEKTAADESLTPEGQDFLKVPFATLIIASHSRNVWQLTPMNVRLQRSYSLINSLRYSFYTFHSLLYWPERYKEQRRNRLDPSKCLHQSYTSFGWNLNDPRLVS